MRILTYVDGKLIDTRPYSDFPDDSDAHPEGFGIWSSTPGTTHLIVNEIFFMDQIPINFMVLSRWQIKGIQASVGPSTES